MRCHICDSQDDSISIDPRDGKYRPCSTCQNVIQDSLVSQEEEDAVFIIDEEFDVGC